LNFRELKNVVHTLRDETIAGNLKDSLIILCTDNSTVEASSVKGSSSSEKLFNLALEVCLLEMQEGAKIVVSHVSGERMKAQGTNGVSRGQLKEGVSTGQSMLSFVPFHLSAIQGSDDVEAWLRSWLGESMEVLSP
jgi:predicted transcriptional regulator